MKRILTIQDISCVGKCSLTVALPIISALGIETAIIPTAVLSTHTMFDNFTCADLTNQIVPITEHWKKEKIGFDSIYTGYLGTIEQINMISNIFDDFKTDDNQIIVDPAMADNGKLYPAFDMAYAKKMGSLAAKADFLIPNITEASFMVDLEYKELYDEPYIKEMLKRLTNLGAKTAILTGVSFDEKYSGIMGYDSQSNEYYHYKHLKINKCYHGTGDIFASTFVGALLNGLLWKESSSIAADYTALCIQTTLDDENSRWYGVNFEQCIPYLLNRVKK